MTSGTVEAQVESDLDQLVAIPLKVMHFVLD